MAKPNQVWVSDITYIWTAEGWLYLAVILDLFSRQVVGWSMNNRINRKLVMDALLIGTWRAGQHRISYFTLTVAASIAAMIPLKKVYFEPPS